MAVKASLPSDVRSHLLESSQRHLIVDMANRIIPAIGRSLPSTSEIVLHDLSLLPNSIVAIWGNVTNRQVGDPPTDLLLEHIVRGAHHDLIGYHTNLPDGRQLQSSTVILRDSSEAPVGALCVNSDVSVWLTLGKVAQQMAGESAALEPALQRTRLDPRLTTDHAQYMDSRGDLPSKEVFPKNVDQLASHLIQSAIKEIGVPVDEMRKEHKVEVVKVLQERGIFLLRDAAETVAASIGVSRFTVYNYIKEIDGEHETDPQSNASSALSEE